MTLRLVPEVLDTVDMVSGLYKFLRVIKAVMSELRYIQSIIAQKAISIDNAAWLYCLSNDRNHCILFSIGDDIDGGLAASLEQLKYWNFVSCAVSALPFQGAAKVASSTSIFPESHGSVSASFSAINSRSL
jgi:hypothetical protein